jgi:DNA-binding NarL/FixJ family response regulator
MNGHTQAAASPGRCTAINVLIIEDHPVVVDGIKEYFGRGKRYRILAESSFLIKALALIDECNWDVALIDYQLNGQPFNGVDLVERILQHKRDAKCVVMTTGANRLAMGEAYLAGAKGFVCKEHRGEEYIKAIEAAFDGRRCFPAELAEILPGIINERKLTRCEKRLMPFLARGLTSKEIALELGRYSRTIDCQIDKIKEKKDLGSRRKLVAFAVRWCLAKKIDF